MCRQDRQIIMVNLSFQSMPTIQLKNQKTYNRKYVILFFCEKNVNSYSVNWFFMDLE